MRNSKKDVTKRDKNKKELDKKAEEIMDEIDSAFDKIEENEKKELDGIEKELDTKIEEIDAKHLKEGMASLDDTVIIKRDEDESIDEEEEVNESIYEEEMTEVEDREKSNVEEESKDNDSDEIDDSDDKVESNENESKEEEPKEESEKTEKLSKTKNLKDKEFWGDTTVIDTGIMDKIEDEFEEDLKSFKQDKPTVEKDYSYKNHISMFLLVLICVAIFFSATYFVAVLLNPSSKPALIVNTAILCVFSIVYLMVCVSAKRKHYWPVYISTILLIGYFVFNMNMPVSTTTSVSGKKVQNFSYNSLTDLVKWANKNDIKINQEYEYSDMVPEYQIISQSVKEGTSIDDVEEITVSVSEGPNPYKEIIVPSMLTWDSERVVNYVLSNYLSNVNVEFVESDQVKDTLIEQSKSGNSKRNDELALTFSYGDEGNSDEVTLIDFTDMSKFEIEFYMKQHKLNYDFVYDFSDSIKKDHGVSQSIKAGEVVGVDGDKIQVTISKGPIVRIPDLKKQSVEEITEWAIKNHLKLEFIDKYDDSVKKGKIISVDREKDDVVEQGTLIQVTLSLGNLKMPKFKSADEFYKWADKYEIKYEVRHEFSKTVDAGEIISFSYKTGEVIKNNEAIVVTISDGKNVEVPNLKGLTKSEAIKKLKNAGLKYNFVYDDSSSKKDTVIGQSISAGSEITSGMTITVTLSNGGSDNNTEKKGDNNTVKPSPSPKHSPNPSPSPSPSQSPASNCNSCTVLSSGIKNIIAQKVKDNAGYTSTANAVISYIEGQCPGIDVQVRAIKDTGLASGKIVPNMNSWSGGDTTSCSTVHLYLAA